MVSDIEIKYKLHVCFVKQKQYQKAIEMLQSVPTRSRTAKINMALGNLHRDNGAERTAIACYKEVLRENPMAIDAAENLLNLGVEGTEVNSYTLTATTELNWLNAWLRSFAHTYARDLGTALQTFKSLDQPGLLRNSPILLTNMAKCYTLQCDYTNAMNCMQRALRVYPQMKKGRDLYAFLLAQNSTQKESVKELERLAYSESPVNCWSAEQWVVNGYLMLVNKTYERATYFGNQALVLDKKNVEALLLKANAFFQLNKYNEAIRNGDEVRQIAPHRFEGHKIVVDCYMAMGNHLSDALRYALLACKQLNNSPQVLTVRNYDEV